MALLPRLVLALAGLASTLAAGPVVSFQQLFVSNYTAYPTCYRQPVLVALDALRMIVFIEGRNNTWCSGTSDGSPSSIRVKYTRDGGASWSSEAVLYTGGVDFLCAVYDPISPKTHLFIQLGSKILYTTTADAGATFSPVGPLTVGIPNGIAYAQPSVAHGLVVDSRLCGDGTCGGKGGRLVIPFICHSTGQGRTAASARLQALALRGQYSSLSKGDVACPGCYTCLLTSDDRGASWAIGAVSNQEGTREASLMQLAGQAYGVSNAAVLYATERNMGAVPGYRQHALSVDAGSSFSVYGNDTGIPDCKTANWTGVVAGGTRVGQLSSTGPTGPQRLIISTPLNRTARQDMGLFVSTDEAHTWSSGTLLRAGPAGYSDIAAVNASHVAVVFENGDDDGEYDFAKRVSFGVFNAFGF